MGMRMVKVMAKVMVKMMGLETDRVAPSWANKTKERQLRKKMTMHRDTIAMVFSGVLMKIIAQSIAIIQSQTFLQMYYHWPDNATTTNMVKLLL